MKNTKSDFESIIPTALHTIYPLIYTDIPYVKEIFDELCKKGFPEELKNDKLVFEIEARYKLIDDLLDKTNITQILELACGFTPRGLNYCLKNPNIVYVELDLQKVISGKQEILDNIVEVPKNLHFVAGNALDKNDLQKCLKHFDLSKPIAIINQGLMRYLDFDEKRLLASNVHSIIEQNNGVWLTCDFTPAAFIKNQDNNLSDGNNYNKNLAKVTDRNNASWRFKDKDNAEQFVKPIGLKIEWHEFTESIPMLSSIKILKQTEKKVEPYLKDAYVSVLTANKDKGEKMTTEEQSENKQVYINELIFNKLGQTAKILKKLDTTNNDVYIISSNNKEYILKFYKNRTWPEDGKNLYVNSLLEKNNIPFAKVVAYTRDCDFSDGGYILEEKIKGGSVNMDKLSTNEGEEYYSLLAKFIKKVHQIKFDNFGYINNGKPLYSNFYEYLKDDLEDHSKLLIENNLISQEDLKRIQKHFKDVFANGNFKPCLCHGDLSLRNAIVYNNKLVLIDYDDSMVLPAFADIARMTFDMRPYKAYLSWRQAFLNSYFQDIDEFKTYENFEKTYHIYCAIDWIDFALKKGYDYTNLYDYLKTLLSSID